MYECAEPRTGEIVVCECDFPHTNLTGGTVPCDRTFAQYIGMEYTAFRAASLALWIPVLLASTDRAARLLFCKGYEHVQQFQRTCIYAVWVCAASGLISSIDPLGYANVIKPVPNQVATDIATCSLASIMIVFVFSFKQAADAEGAATYPQRTRQMYLSVLFIWVGIPMIGTPLMMIQDNLLWRSIKLLMLCVVLLSAMLTFTLDFYRVRAVLLEQHRIGDRALKPVVKSQLQRLQYFAWSVYLMTIFTVGMTLYICATYLTKSAFFRPQVRWVDGTRGFPWKVQSSPETFPLQAMSFRAIQYLAVACTFVCVCRIEENLSAKSPLMQAAAPPSLSQALSDKTSFESFTLSADLRFGLSTDLLGDESQQEQWGQLLASGAALPTTEGEAEEEKGEVAVYGSRKGSGRSERDGSSFFSPLGLEEAERRRGVI